MKLKENLKIQQENEELCRNKDKEDVDNFKNIIETTGWQPDKKEILTSGYMKIGRIVGISFYRHEAAEDIKKSSKKNKPTVRLS